MRNKIYFTALLITSLHLCYGQPSQEIQFEDLVQELFQQQDEDIDYEAIYESLLQYYTDPLDLNKTSREDLQQLFVLSPLQINNFIEYRKNTGPLLSLYELQTIPAFDYYTIQKLRPFITISTTEKNTRTFIKKMIANPTNYILLRYGRIPEDPLYAGDGNQYYLRYKNSKPNDFSYGITLEKDGGEKIRWDPAKKQYGLDFLSYHFTLFNKGKIKAMSLGDYQLQFGQGLVLSSGFRLGKGSETILTTKKNNSGVKPYSSTLEFGFFRGAAATISLGLAEITGFYSNKNIDGSLQQEDGKFSPAYTGYHRTPSEINKRSSINEQVYGGNISVRNRSSSFHTGLTVVNTAYSYYLKKSPTVYNGFDFSGKTNFTGGVDMSYRYQNFIFFGESAMSESRGKGIVAGFISNLSRQLEASMVIRNYERNFHSFYSNAFGENSTNANEKGIYWGLKFKPTFKWTLSCYYDRFSFPWLKYLVDAPSEGEEYLGRITYQPSKTTVLYAQYRQEIKEKNVRDNLSSMDYPVNSTKRNFLFHVEVKASPNLTTKTRVQFSSYNQAQSNTLGYAFINDLDYRIHPFFVSMRFALFDTDNFENRQYVYEKDVLYSFSIPAYSGKGTRVYVVLKFKLLKNTDVWFKYSRTNYIGQEKMQDKAEETSSPSSDIRIQLRYSFR